MVSSYVRFLHAKAAALPCQLLPEVHNRLVTTSGKPHTALTSPHATMDKLRRLAFALLLTCCGSASAGPPLEHVRMQLRWTHQFQFAGYYAAVQQGFYREAGLDVELIPGNNVAPAITRVVNGEADFGVTNAGLAQAYIEGKPVVALAAILQSSPSVWITTGDLTRPADLVGKRLMSLPPPENAELLAVFLYEGIPLDQLKLEMTSYRLEDLIEGKADAFNAYISNEPDLLRARGIPFNVISPRQYGVDFYSEVLFTSQEQIRKHPERVRAFRAATLKGWQYALDHQEEIVRLIHTRYAPHLSLEHLRYEAQEITKLVLPTLVPLGHMNPGRWQHIADTYHKLGMVRHTRPLDGMIYDPEPPRADLRPLYYTLAGISVLLLAAAGLAMTYRRLYRQLQHTTAEREAALREVRRLAHFDPLTHLPNRLLLDELMGQALATARRQRQQVAVCFIDLDGFKPINDELGHAAGDHVLQEIAARLRKSLRTSDVVARWGGDEFVAVLPDTSEMAAIECMAQVRDRLAQSLRLDGHDYHVNASVGIAMYPTHSENRAELLELADQAMYCAKTQGKGRTCVAARPGG